MESITNLYEKPSTNEWISDSKEIVLDKIETLLRKIDGKERPELTILETKENIKGEPLFIVFTNGEKEVIDGVEHEITYLLTIAGQRYKADGTPGRMIEKTFLVKDFDDGMYGSEEMADYVDSEWVNIRKKELPEQVGITEEYVGETVISQERLIIEYANLIEQRSTLAQEIQSVIKKSTNYKKAISYESMDSAKEELSKIEEETRSLLEKQYTLDRDISRIYTQMDAENREQYLTLRQAQALRDVKTYHTKPTE